jgi:hypothetical protein
MIEMSSDGDYEIPPLNPLTTPMPSVVKPEGTDFEDVTRYTQERRLQLAEALAPKIASEDPKVINAYLKTLDGMDKAVSTKRRLGIEEAVQATSAEEAKASADLLKTIERRMFQLPEGQVANRVIPKLGDFPAPKKVDGEMDIGVASMSYESFMKGGLITDEES